MTDKTLPKIENLFTSTTQYAQSRVLQLRYKIFKRLTDAGSAAVKTGLVACFDVVCWLFLNVGLAFWLGEITHSVKAGFFLTALLNLVCMGVYLLLHKSLVQQALQNRILSSISGEYTSYDDLLSLL